MATARKSHSFEWLFYFLTVVLLAGCARAPSPVMLGGSTMGTRWHVTYLDAPDGLRPVTVQLGIEAVLERINGSMSTYKPDSEISRFNQTAVDTPITLSEDFRRVLATALDIGERSEGAYDVTVGPLVDLWGFGPGEPVYEVPPPASLDAVRARVGQDKLHFLADGRVQNSVPLELDFSSLAKGFAVDEVAALLHSKGISRYLVEVGGEMRLAGQGPRGGPWRIAIEEPHSGAQAVARAIMLTDHALATSGDYRNYFEVDGRRYSHSIDPRTGYPAAHDLVSVTVVHDSAMAADAWATALAVLGAERAMAVALAEGLAVYFIQRTDSGLIHSHTPSFTAFLAESGAES